MRQTRYQKRIDAILERRAYVSTKPTAITPTSTAGMNTSATPLPTSLNASSSKSFPSGIPREKVLQLLHRAPRRNR